MGYIGVLIGVVSFFFMVIGLIPFLGWLNWFVAPFAFIGLFLSILGVILGNGRFLGFIGAVLCSIVVIISAARLIVGFGIV
jgi:hypothetical protein